MNKIKYGIIGAGTMAREHINNISIIEDAEVVALSDPDDHSLEKSKKIAPNLKEKLSDYLDISFNSFEHTISSSKTIIKRN